MPPEILSLLQIQAFTQPDAQGQSVTQQESTGAIDGAFDALIAEYANTEDTIQSQTDANIFPDIKHSQTIYASQSREQVPASTASRPLTLGKGLSGSVIDILTGENTREAAKPDTPQSYTEQPMQDTRVTWRNLFADVRKNAEAPSKYQDIPAQQNDFDDGVVAVRPENDTLPAEHEAGNVDESPANTVSRNVPDDDTRTASDTPGDECTQSVKPEIPATDTDNPQPHNVPEDNTPVASDTPGKEPTQTVQPEIITTNTDNPQPRNVPEPLTLDVPEYELTQTVQPEIPPTNTDKPQPLNFPEPRTLDVPDNDAPVASDTPGKEPTQTLQPEIITTNTDNPQPRNIPETLTSDVPEEVDIASDTLGDEHTYTPQPEIITTNTDTDEFTSLKETVAQVWNERPTRENDAPPSDSLQPSDSASQVSPAEIGHEDTSATRKRPVQDDTDAPQKTETPAPAHEGTIRRKFTAHEARQPQKAPEPAKNEQIRTETPGVETADDDFADTRTVDVQPEETQTPAPNDSQPHEPSTDFHASETAQAPEATVKPRDSAPAKTPETPAIPEADIVMAGASLVLNAPDTRQPSTTPETVRPIVDAGKTVTVQPEYTQEVLYTQAEPEAPETPQAPSISQNEKPSRTQPHSQPSRKTQASITEITDDTPGIEPETLRGTTADTQSGHEQREQPQQNTGNDSGNDGTIPQERVPASPARISRTTTRTDRTESRNVTRTDSRKLEALSDFQSFFDGATRAKHTASRVNTRPLSLRTATYTASTSQPQSHTLRNGIVNTVRFIRADGVRKANIVIDPPALGRITVELTSSSSGVEASVKVASEQIRQIVQDQFTQLKENLAQQGVQVSEFTVDVQQDTTGQGQDSGGQNQRNPYTYTASEDDDDTENFRVDLEEGLLYWVA